MITIRPAAERGHTQIAWLDSRHSFSFGGYRDPSWTSFGPLRVINDDRIAPGFGFPTHPHRDMEIVSFVYEGTLAHQDSTGAAEQLRPNEVQRMTAGTGVRHSEFNPSATEETRLLQVWLFPEHDGLEPGYEQKSFDPAEKAGRMRLVVSRDGREGSVRIHQDADIYAAILRPAETIRHDVKPGRRVWLQVASGSVELNGQTLVEGDGAAIVEETVLELAGKVEGEILLFDMH